MQRPELDIEAKLKADHSGHQKNSLMYDLRSQAELVRGQLNKGVPSSDYQRLEALLAAFESAEQVVEEVWQSIHDH